MAYENDDLKPSRPRKVLDVLAEAPANCTEVAQPVVSSMQEEALSQNDEESLSVQAPTTSQATRAGDDDLRPVRPLKPKDVVVDTRADCAEKHPIVSQRQEDVLGKTDESMSIRAPTPSHATRAGDDDLRPRRPSDEVLSKRPEVALSPCDQVQRVQEPSDDSSEHPQERNAVYEKYGLLKLVAYACVAIVAIWLLGSFGSVLHSIAISESISEMLVFVAIFLIEVSVVWYVIYFAKKTFAKLPEVVQLHRKGQSDQTLARQLRNDYILQFPEPGQYAKFAGFDRDDEALQLLVRLRDHKYADSAGFMNEYDQFQAALDKRASGVIKKYAKLIGLKTAASPWKAVDIIAVFFNSTLMVCDIASVYHRQVSRQTAFRLVVRWFINIYISGELGQVAEGAADAIAKGTSEWLGEDGVSAVLQPAVPLLAKFGGKIAEGGINAYLAYRLGRRASEYFKELVD